MKKIFITSYRFVLNNLPWILLFLALIPSANYHIFNGFPFSSLPEYALLLSLLPFVLLSKYSHLYKRVLGRLWHKLPLLFLLLAIFATAAKLILYQSKTYQGFTACYKSSAAAPSIGDCERSYENPFFRFGATRIDQSLSFDASNWNLGFVNSNRFNFLSWETGSIDRKRIPLSAEWSGLVKVDESKQVIVTYVGEGQIRIDENETILPVGYNETNQVILSLSKGIHNVEVKYTFDDGYRIGDEDPGENAFIKLRYITDSDERFPIKALPPALIWRILGNFVDLITAALWASIIFTYIVLLRWKLWVVLAIFLVGWGSYIAPEMPGLTSGRLLLVFIGALFVYLLLQRHLKNRLLIAYLCLASLGLFRILMDSHSLGTVLVQYGGSDQLTYMSFAREILETGSLRAGEAIFYYQPAYRYLSFFLNLLLGESNVFVSAIAVTAINWGIFFVSFSFFQYTTSILQRLFLLGTIFTVLMLCNSSQVIFDLIQYGTSEYPTWIILSLSLGLILSPRTSRYWPIITFLVGLGMIIRTEQIPAIALLYVIFLIRIYSTGKKLILPSLFLLLLIFFLPAFHNLYYGHVLEILPISRNIHENIAIAPITAITNLEKKETWDILFQQFKDVTGFGSEYYFSMGLALPLHIVQIFWMFSCFFVLVRWRSMNWVLKLLLLLPFPYLSIYLFYHSHFDYPRHVLAGLIAMGFGVLTVISGFGRRESIK